MEPPSDDSDSGTQASIDTTRVPRGEIAAAELVRAIAASDDRVERHYLEIKGPLNFAQKHDLAKIAKFILAAANRMPDVAARAFDGYGVMVIGVADHRATGMPPVEVLDIDKFVRPVIGVDGPKWDIVRVSAEEPGNEVLLVLVDPPRVGQGPFLCRKSSGELVDGRTYVRNEGATDEATAAQIDQLLARGQREVTPSDPFEVGILGAAHPLTDAGAVLEEHIRGHRERLLAPLAPKPPVASSTTSFAGGFSALSKMNLEAIASIASSMEEPEKRSEKQYRSQIDEWERELRAAWPAAIERLAGRLLAGVGVRIRNRTKTFFQGVELAIHLEGDVRGIGHFELGERISARDLNLPSPPRLWGPQQRRLGLDMTNPVLSGAYAHAISPASRYVSKLDWHNSGSVDLTLKVGDLRPLGSYEFENDEIVLVLPEAWTGSISGIWAVTAQSYHEVFEGSLVVEPGELCQLDRALRGLLKLEDSDA